jgi:hypothetical protein
LSLAEISDRLEIQQLLVDHSTAIDNRRFDDLDKVFTPDAAPPPSPPWQGTPLVPSCGGPTFPASPTSAYADRTGQTNACDHERNWHSLTSKESDTDR